MLTVFGIVFFGMLAIIFGWQAWSATEWWTLGWASFATLVCLLLLALLVWGKMNPEAMPVDLDEEEGDEDVEELF